MRVRLSIVDTVANELVGPPRNFQALRISSNYQLADRNCRYRALGALVCVLASFTCLTSRAERAAYSFQGQFPGTASHTYNLFGYSVPQNAIVTGTFSYDTTTPADEIQTGVDEYHQYIDAGLTLDLNQGQVKITASDYAITVANDQGSPSSDSFSVDYYNFNSNGVDPTVQPLVVTGANGTSSWTGLGSIKVYLSWGPDTFPDPSLTADAPTTPNPSVTAFVGSATSGTGVSAKFFSPPFSPAPFLISAIPSLAGDYNRNGIMDDGDYTEWRKAFGESSPEFLYADGNGDGVVDDADYVVWRHAMAAGSGAALTQSVAQSASVPEPTGVSLWILACGALAVKRSSWSAARRHA